MSSPIIVGYQQDQSYTAQADRAVQNVRMKHGGTGLAGDVAASNGVVMGGAANLDTSIVSGMNLQIDAGMCMVAGYSVVIPTALNRTVQPSTSSARRDLVVVRVYDVEAGDATSKADVEIIKGTTTSDPALPARCLVLSQVDIGANASTVTLTERRVGTAAAGGLRATPTFPANNTGLAPGEMIYAWQVGRNAQATNVPGGLSAIARRVGSGIEYDTAIRNCPLGVWSPFFTDRSFVVPYHAGCIQLMAEVQVKPNGGPAAFDLEIYWNNVKVAAIACDTHGTDSKTYSIRAAVGDVPPGTYGLCFLAVRVGAGSPIDIHGMTYSWAAIG